MELVWSLSNNKVTFLIWLKFWNGKGSQNVCNHFGSNRFQSMKKTCPRTPSPEEQLQIILLAFSTENLFFGQAHWGNGNIFSLALPKELAKAEVLELAEELNGFWSSKRGASWPSVLKSYFKDESYTKRDFEVMLPQAQRSFVELSCRYVLEKKLSEQHCFTQLICLGCT